MYYYFPDVPKRNYINRIANDVSCDSALVFSQGILNRSENEIKKMLPNTQYGEHFLLFQPTRLPEKRRTALA